MKKFVLLILSAFFLLADANAFDVELLSNNKESVSREQSDLAKSQAEGWRRMHSLREQLKHFSLKALSETFNEMEKIDTTCDFGLVEKLRADALRFRLIETPGELSSLIEYYRAENLIDDILYKILKTSELATFEFKNSVSRPAQQKPYNVLTRHHANIKLSEFYAPFKKWPDDKNKCTIDTYFEMVKKLDFKNNKDRDNQLTRLNWLAYRNGIIDLESYNKFELLKKYEVLDWKVYFKRYADIINNAKDKMTKNPEPKTTNDFSVEYVSRRDGLTQRTNLYRTFSSTQVIILSQIIEKTAKRIDARTASISWQFGEDPADQEIYVMSPMEKYRASIRMLRKEMAEVMRSEAFKGPAVEFDHLIAAAYETGLIKSTELEVVLKFEDFWNPKTPKSKAYANFAFSVAGTATFYLPPPWNVIGAIGLVLTQSKIANKDRQPDEDDNWNVIL